MDTKCYSQTRIVEKPQAADRDNMILFRYGYLNTMVLRYVCRPLRSSSKFFLCKERVYHYDMTPLAGCWLMTDKNSILSLDGELIDTLTFFLFFSDS